MKECVTHHNACDCREEKIMFVCKEIMKEHNELKKFTAGFKQAEKCNCSICLTIKDLYDEKIL